MGIKSRREDLQSILERYQRVERTFKSKILGELCEVDGYHPSMPCADSEISLSSSTP